MPKLLEPGVARRLLVTAASRQHAAAVKHMVKLAYMWQHINAATLETMLAELLKHDACVGVLMQLSAAAQLSSEAVIGVLLAAAAGQANSGLFSGVDALCQLPRVQQLDTATVLQLLQAAIQQGYMPWSFCGLPAAQQLSSVEVLQLLQAAVQLGLEDMPELCNLPGAQQLDSAAVLQLLQAAVQLDIEDMPELCDLPGAQQLDSAAVLQLLQAAVQGATAIRGVMSLCHLPGAQQMDGQAVLQLLQAAVQHAEMDADIILTNCIIASDDVLRPLCVSCQQHISSTVRQPCSCCRQLCCEA
jgi:hypothetical protein